MQALLAGGAAGGEGCLLCEVADARLQRNANAIHISCAGSREVWVLVAESPAAAADWLVAMMLGVGGHLRDQLLAGSPKLEPPDVLDTLKDRQTGAHVRNDAGRKRPHLPWISFAIGVHGECCCSCSTHGLSTNMMALIASYCG